MKKSTRILALATSVMLLLAACGPKDPAPSKNPNSNTPNASKDTLTVAIGTEPSSIDPQNSNMVTASMISAHVLDRLFRADENYEIKNDLATEYDWVDDTTLHVKIRDDVNFSNGDHLTSEDVVYSIRRACNLRYSAASFEYFDGDATKALDEYTVEIKLKSPYPNAMKVLAGSRGSIVCKRALEEMGDDAYGRAPVGSGKFTVKNWSSGDKIELVRNENYWGEKPAYKNLTFRIITENSSRTIEVETGGADIAFNVQPTDVARLESNSDVKVIKGNSSTMNHIVINAVNFDTLKDPKVRLAMHMALDKDAIVKVAFKDNATVATSLAPESATEYAACTPIKFDPEGAKKLIEESGFDTSTEIVLQVYKNAQIQSVAEIIANMWKAIGLNVRIEILDRATMVTNNSTGKTPMCITTVTASDGNIESVFRQWEKPETGFTDNKDLIARLKSVKGIVDDNERKATYAALLQECWDLNTVIPLAVDHRIFAIRSNVQGFVFSPDNTPDLSHVTFG